MNIFNLKSKIVMNLPILVHLGFHLDAPSPPRWRPKPEKDRCYKTTPFQHRFLKGLGSILRSNSILNRGKINRKMRSEIERDFGEIFIENGPPKLG